MQGRTNVIRLHLKTLAYWFVRSLPQDLLVFTGICAHKRRKIRMHRSIPGTAEYNAIWRYLFPDCRSIRLDCMNRATIEDRCGALHG